MFRGEYNRGTAKKIRGILYTVLYRVMQCFTRSFNITVNARGLTKTAVATIMIGASNRDAADTKFDRVSDVTTYVVIRIGARDEDVASRNNAANARALDYRCVFFRYCDLPVESCVSQLCLPPYMRRSSDECCEIENYIFSMFFFPIPVDLTHLIDFKSARW